MYELFSKRLTGWRLSPQLVNPVIDRQPNPEDAGFINSSSINEFILNVLAGGRPYTSRRKYITGSMLTLPWTLPFCLICFPAFLRWAALLPRTLPSMASIMVSALLPPQSSGAESFETSEVTSHTKLCLLQLIGLGHFCHNSKNLVKILQEVKSWREAKYASHGKHIHFLRVLSTNHAQSNFIVANDLFCLLRPLPSDATPSWRQNVTLSTVAASA